MALAAALTAALASHLVPTGRAQFFRRAAPHAFRRAGREEDRRRSNRGQEVDT